MRTFYYHLTFGGETPERWVHNELDPSDGTPYPIPFELYWARFPDEVPELIGDRGIYPYKLAF